MSTLVVQIPARSRLRARDQDAAPTEPPSATTEFGYALSQDGMTVADQGHTTAALLPRANTVVAVMADTDVSWHRITLPKAPASRLRAALIGLLEDALLEDTTDIHVAVAPGATAGQPTWVAVTHRAWLVSHLALLNRGRVFVDRVVPSSWPDDPPVGHFAQLPAREGERAAMVLTWAHADGVATMSLQGGLARQLLPDPLPPAARLTASPSAAGEAGAWLGAAVGVLSPAQRALQATRSTWNLRQFDLAPRHKGTRALRDAWRRFRSPAWRPVRVGLAGLVVVQLIGLNLWAWQQRQAIDSRRAAMISLLRSSFPQVQAVLDAPVQMQRETDALRAAAGRSGDSDLEPLLRAAASAWPENRPAVESLRYEPGRLTLSANGWGNEEIEAFRSRLLPGGWNVESADGRLTLSRGGTATAPARGS